MVTALSFLILIVAFLGAPLFAILGSLGALYLVNVSEVPIQAIITQVKTLMEAPGIIALPLFTFMGYILGYSKTSERVSSLSNAWLGWLPGGLSLATVAAYTLFSALTGGSAIAVMALGGVYYKALLKSGYDKNFSLGLCTVCGGEGMLFPPSLPVIVIGFVAYQAIDQLYVAALIPGIVCISIFMAYCIVHSLRAKVPSLPFSWESAWVSLKDVALEAPLPILIICGIYLGWMSVPEVAGVSLAYVLVTQTLIRKEIGRQELAKSAQQAMILTGAIFAIIVSALVFSNFLVDYQIPQKALEFVKRFVESKYTFLILLNIFLVITGCLMDVFSAILVTVPMLLPISEGYGINPLHFCAIFLWNLEIGYSTPPIGFNLFIGAFRFREPIDVLWRAVMPRLAFQVLGLIVITYIPEITLWLPKTLGMTKELIPYMQVAF